MGTARILKVTAGGETRYYAPTGANYVSLKSGALAASVPLTLPATLPPTVDLPLVVSSAGVIGYGPALVASTPPTLQTVYDTGEDVTLTAGKSITFTQPLDEALLALTKSGAAAGRVATITDAGTGGALLITQTGNAKALEITKAAGAAGIATITGSGAISGSALALSMPAAGSGKGLEVDQLGTGIGAQITKTGGSNPIVDVVGVSTISGTGARITMPAAGTGIGLDVIQLANVVAAQFRKNGTGAGTCVFVENDGTGIGLNIQQDGNGIGCKILCAAVTEGLRVTQGAAGAGGRAAVFEKTGIGDGTCVDIIHNGYNGIALRVETVNAVTCAEFTQGNAAPCIQAICLAAAGGTACITCDNQSTIRGATDIKGTSNAWNVTRYGAAKFGRINLTTSTTYTIATGAITIFGSNDGGIIVVDTEAAAATDDLDTITLAAAPSGNPIIILKITAVGKTVVVRHNGGGTGNIRLLADANYTMAGLQRRLVLVWDAVDTAWCEIGRG